MIASSLCADSTDAALLIARVALGLTMAAHGYGKFFRGGKIAVTGAVLRSGGGVMVVRDRGRQWERRRHEMDRITGLGQDRRD